jgi:hypothetical protein
MGSVSFGPSHRNLTLNTLDFQGVKKVPSMSGALRAPSVATRTNTSEFVQGGIAMRKALPASGSQAAVDAAIQTFPPPKSPDRKPVPFKKPGYDDDAPSSDPVPLSQCNTSRLPPTRGPPLDPRIYGLVKAAYSVNETLEVLSLGRTSLYSLIADGVLKPVKFGKKTLFLAPNLAAFLAKLQEIAK